jgi:hypothetical protein
VVDVSVVGEREDQLAVKRLTDWADLVDVAAIAAWARSNDVRG